MTTFTLRGGGARVMRKPAHSERTRGKPSVTSESENGSRPQTAARRARFQERFRRALRQSGVTLDDLSQQTGIDLPTLRRWRRQGVTQPQHEHIEKLAFALGIADPWSMFVEAGASERDEFDRLTNPVVDEVRRDRPDLFVTLDADEWRELYAAHGTGGPLTYDGVIAYVERVAAKRELRRKFEAVIETHHFDVLAAMIEVLYRDTAVTSPQSPPPD